LACGGYYRPLDGLPGQEPCAEGAKLARKGVHTHRTWVIGFQGAWIWMQDKAETYFDFCNWLRAVEREPDHGLLPGHVLMSPRA